MSFIASIHLVFWICIALILYVYIGYPFLVYTISRLFPKEINRDEISPNVSIIITAYNEEKYIRKKMENTLRIDYPKAKLEIIVASDCSSDKTDEIVQEFQEFGVKLLRQKDRRGKTQAQNVAVEYATGDVILFSDATSMYNSDVLREMLPNFADDSVGCVAGKLIYVDDSDSAVGTAAKSYWNYETLLKVSESTACSLIGASGCIYAVRRGAYVPMYPEACSDFLIASLLFRNGLRTVYEPNAVCTEETNRRSDKEMRMRVRVISQTFTDLWRNRDLLNPLKSGFFSVELISHKILRYGVPIFLAGLLLSSGILATNSAVFLSAVGGQVAFYASALVAWGLDRWGFKTGILKMPLYFVLANAASIAGFIQFLRGERYASWEPIR